jgi:hypothetical protein
MVRALRATVPISVESIQLSPQALQTSRSAQNWAYPSASNKVGFGTVSIDAELYNSFEDVLLRIKKARCIPYLGNAQSGTKTLRKPLARVVWKPDILDQYSGETNGVKKYIEWYATNLQGAMPQIPFPVRQVGAVLDLFVHKHPAGNVLYLRSDPDVVAIAKAILAVESPLRRCASFHTGTVDSPGILQIQDRIDENTSLAPISTNHKFDVVLTETVNLSLEPLFPLADFLIGCYAILHTNPYRAVCNDSVCERCLILHRFRNPTNI